MGTSAAFLSMIITVPFIGLLFALTAKDDEKHLGRNAFQVSFFTVTVNLFLVWRIFTLLDLKKTGLQLVEKYHWLENPGIDIVFGVDVFSMLLILGVHIALLVGMTGVRHHQEHQKSLMVFSLLFLSMMTGYLVSADVFSFYIFFEAMLLPLFMLVGMFGEIKRQPVIFRFLIYNLMGAALLFVALLILFDSNNVNIALNSIHKVKLSKNMEFAIWAAIFIAFLSRIPVWPFHYWISAISSNIKNPLVFIVANIVPLTGVYGFIRFWPKTVPESVQYYMLALEIICVISMLFIALIGLINKDIQYKIFSYMTVYYIFYLLSAFVPVSTIQLNIGFSLFSYLIVVSAIVMMNSYLEVQQGLLEISPGGILCSVPRTSFVMSFLILAGVGLPLSSMFNNNFVLLAHLFGHNLRMSMVVMFSLVLVSCMLLQELFNMKDISKVCQEKSCCEDISVRMFGFMSAVILVLILSLMNPLWFLGS